LSGLSHWRRGSPRPSGGPCVDATCVCVWNGRRRAPTLARPTRRTAIAHPDDDVLTSRLAANLLRVKERIEEAATRSGRPADAVTLIAVTKSVGVREILALARCGVVDFGENRTDALAEKRAAVADSAPGVRWHMIGRFQTNKARRALPTIDVLHSLDRTSLLDALAAELKRVDGPSLPAFLEVNVSGEESKTGFAPADLPAALDAARRVPRLAVRGLMTMAPLSPDPESARPVFRRLRELRDEARRLGYLQLLELSMGMSQDFEVAVEEGATHVRVGSALYSD
jgi:pyridoxal phosphate enzyme (YggS family)